MDENEIILSLIAQKRQEQYALILELANLTHIITLLQRDIRPIEQFSNPFEYVFKFFCSRLEALEEMYGPVVPYQGGNEKTRKKLLMDTIAKIDTRHQVKINMTQ